MESTVGVSNVVSPGAPQRRDWGESGVLLLSVVLFATLRNRYVLGPPSLTWALGLLVTAVFLLSLLWTIRGDRKAKRTVMAVSTLILAVGIALSLAKVIYIELYQPAAIDPIRLIETGSMIWVGNVIVFAIIYHLIGDREFAFPQPTQPAPQQSMNFLDYVFLSFTTATAFSPTDTPPLSTRVRMLMMFESIISLLVIAIVAARAINILPAS